MKPKFRRVPPVGADSSSRFRPRGATWLREPCATFLKVAARIARTIAPAKSIVFPPVLASGRSLLYNTLERRLYATACTRGRSIEEQKRDPIIGTVYALTAIMGFALFRLVEGIKIARALIRDAACFPPFATLLSLIVFCIFFFFFFGRGGDSKRIPSGRSGEHIIFYPVFEESTSVLTLIGIISSRSSRFEHLGAFPLFLPRLPRERAFAL